MKSLRTWFGLALLAAGIYVGYKLIPPYFNDYQFQDVVESEARMNTYSWTHKSDEDIRAGILKRAEELNVPILPEQIQIARTGNDYTITTDYTVHVDLPIHPVDLNFHATSKK